jgi:hypothetical protein
MDAANLISQLYKPKFKVPDSTQHFKNALSVEQMQFKRDEAKAQQKRFEAQQTTQKNQLAMQQQRADAYTDQVNLMSERQKRGFKKEDDTKNRLSDFVKENEVGTPQYTEKLSNIFLEEGDLGGARKVFNFVSGLDKDAKEKATALAAKKQQVLEVQAKALLGAAESGNPGIWENTVNENWEALKPFFPEKPRIEDADKAIRVLATQSKTAKAFLKMRFDEQNKESLKAAREAQAAKNAETAAQKQKAETQDQFNDSIMSVLRDSGLGNEDFEEIYPGLHEYAVGLDSLEEALGNIATGIVSASNQIKDPATNKIRETIEVHGRDVPREKVVTQLLKDYIRFVRTDPRYKPITFSAGFSGFLRRWGVYNGKLNLPAR